MSEPYTWLRRPDLDQPVLVVMLEGWIDAGGSAALAIAALQRSLDATTVLTFDGDTFIDYRARRPVMELRDGVNTALLWPGIELQAGRDQAGRDVLLLTGDEPDSAWRRFADAVAGLAIDLGVTTAVGLGAYPFAAPHTRPSRLSITASSPELAATLPYLRNSLDVPAGMEAALERALAEREVPAVGLWAQVPHYVASSPYPAASISLLTGLAEVTGIAVDVDELREETDAYRVRLDELVGQNADHVALVRQLEELYDSEISETTGAVPFDRADVPTGDELAAELERFLRDQGPAE